jgi:hypothetical protein
MLLPAGLVRLRMDNREWPQRGMLPSGYAMRWALWGSRMELFEVNRAFLTVILVFSRLGRREDGRPCTCTLAGRDGGRPWTGGVRIALGRQPAVRRRALRRSCQSGCGECPAGA